ncbi:MAG: spore germination protein [Oscillospiraceae bacterium]|jgi:spore germination protein KA|nr:spore germination protein [Oscillospiraceae bacterium]
MFKKTDPKPHIPDRETVCVSNFRARMTESDDTVYTDYVINRERNLHCTVIFIDGMISSDIAYEHVLQPLLTERGFAAVEDGRGAVEAIMRGRVYHGQRKELDTMTDALAELLFGGLLVVFDDCATAVSFDSKGFEKRGIAEPTNENVLKGSRESFVESLRVNTSIVRRYVRSEDLKVHQLTVGRRTNTSVAVVYIDGIANSETTAKIIKKFEDEDTDGLTTAGQVESVLYENTLTMFPQAMYTERPDKLVGCLLEGRVGIIVDGLSLAYITPIDFHSLMQAPEDYAHHYVLASFFRILRYTCTVASLVLPAFYVAVTTFHQEMIPTKLVVSIISSKRGVPFPTYMEVLLMLLAFEVLLEAGLRLPRAVGQAVSIVGALVVGQAAITANILSPGVVIIIAAAGITGFVVPSQDLSNINRTYRIILVLFATAGGLFATTLGLILIIYGMCEIEIFGTPYLSPSVANEGRQMYSDTILRRNWSGKRERPINIYPEDLIRQAPPKPQNGGENCGDSE